MTPNDETNSETSNPFRRRDPEAAGREAAPEVHKFKNGTICRTDSKGHATPKGRSIFEIVVDASGGFIPLWDKDVTLRWRFQEISMLAFEDPAEAKAAIEQLFGEALLQWGDAVPVKFAKRNNTWDFEIAVRANDDCDTNGCVLAMAFFPDSGRHELVIYPKMFQQSREEQVATLVHELGHVFGLRHFFANIREQAWASHIVGTHNRFTIMNYGSDSVLTDADRSDLKSLYEKVWSGELTDINGTPIKLQVPFHTARGRW